MKYIDHGSGGGPEVLVLAEGDIPEVGAGEVLIRVSWAGVNRPDVAQRQGRYPPPADASPHIGLEVAGTIAAVGQGVTEWQRGEEVCALCNGGGYAEFVTAPAGQVLPVPKGLGLREAAALPENYFTVWANLIERGRLVKGETALIHGGTSGIGLTAIALGKAVGAEMFCTVGSEEKAAAAVKAGADLAINYRARDFVAEIRARTEGRGVDVILDMVGGSYIERNLRCLAIEGRLVQIAFLQPSKIEVDWMPLMTKRLTFTGSTLRPRPAAEKARLAAALKQHVWPLIEAGQLGPTIYREFALADAAEAHALMESSEHIGKIMLKVR
jgi:NADPH2:quinone reductase